MTKMFCNYDRKIMHHCGPCCEVECPEALIGWSGSEMIYDPKGNEIGLGFRQGSPIELTFSFCGAVFNDYGEPIDIDDFINSNLIIFELLDHKHNVVYTSEFTGLCEDQYMTLKLNQEVVEELVPEIYYIKLTLITESGNYILFTPQDALLHIS